MGVIFFPLLNGSQVFGFPLPQEVDNMGVQVPVEAKIWQHAPEGDQLRGLPPYSQVLQDLVDVCICGEESAVNGRAGG